MEKSEVQRKVQLATSEEVFRKTGRIFVPVASSARHVHLCRADVERLFGPGHQLTVFRMLSQPGQYACTEQVTIVGPKGQLAKVRVLGPERSATQVEIAMTDSFKLGIKAPVRMSGKTAIAKTVRAPTCHSEEGPQARRGNLAVPGCIVGKLPAKSQLPSRDCHVASLLAMTIRGAFTVLTIVCQFRRCSAGSGMPLPYSGICGRRGAIKK